MEGFIKIERSIEDIGMFREPNVTVLYVLLKCRAAFQPRVFMKNGKKIDLKVGDVAVSIRGLAADTGISERGIRTALKWLNNAGLVTQKATHECTIISIINYGGCSDVCSNDRHTADTQSDIQATHDRHATDTRPTHKIESKNVKKEEEREPARSSSLGATVEEVSAFAKENGLVIDAQRFVDYHAARGWKTKSGQLLINWQAEARNWAKTEKPAQSADEYRPLAPVPTGWDPSRLDDERMPDWGAPKSSGGYVCRALARRGIC